MIIVFVVSNICVNYHIPLDTAADCSPKTTTRDKLKSCPNQYYMDQDTKKPWSIKASTKCVFKAAEFTKFEIKPTEEACSDISIVSTETLERTDHKICEFVMDINKMFKTDLKSAALFSAKKCNTLISLG